MGDDKMNDIKMHPCERCGFSTTQEYFIKAPCISFPDRELRQFLCLFCAGNLEDSGVEIKKITFTEVD